MIMNQKKTCNIHQLIIESIAFPVYTLAPDWLTVVLWR